MEKCDRQVIDCVSECSKNDLKGNVPLTNAQMSKLRPRREDLRALSVKKTSLAKKRKKYSEGRLSIGTACTRVVGTSRSTAKIMQQQENLFWWTSSIRNIKDSRDLPTQ